MEMKIEEYTGARSIKVLEDSRTRECSFEQSQEHSNAHKLSNDPEPHECCIETIKDCAGLLPDVDHRLSMKLYDSVDTLSHSVVRPSKTL